MAREQTNKAFTLIELVITMAIIGIMATVTIISLSGSKTRKDVETEAIRAESVLRQAQNYALTGTGTSAGCNTVRVFKDTAGNIIVWMVRSPTSSIVCSPVLLTYVPQNGVTVSTAEQVKFAAPNGNVYNNTGTELSGSGTRRFTLEKDGIAYSVCIYPLGRIDRAMGSTCP